VNPGVKHDVVAGQSRPVQALRLRPLHRRRGYATEILRQSLVIARAAGVDRVLLICDQDNAGSRAVIEACGGVLDSVVTVDGEPPVLRFWID
jgi:predicted acetyltransferase